VQRDHKGEVIGFQLRRGNMVMLYPTALTGEGRTDLRQPRRRIIADFDHDDFMGLARRPSDRELAMVTLFAGEFPGQKAAPLSTVEEVIQQEMRLVNVYRKRPACSAPRQRPASTPTETPSSTTARPSRRGW
jgi:hypothetical protein